MSVLQPFECSAAIMLHIYKARNPLGSQWWRAHKKSIKIQICLIPFFCTTSDDEKLCHLRHRIHRIIHRNERECLNHVVELLEGSRELRGKKKYFPSRHLMSFLQNFLSLLIWDIIWNRTWMLRHRLTRKRSPCCLVCAVHMRGENYKFREFPSTTIQTNLILIPF